MTEASPAAASGLAGSEVPARVLDAAMLFAIDPAGLGGIVVRARQGPARDRWLAYTRSLFALAPWRRLPLNISDDRLQGGLDLAATLKAGKPIAERGLLAMVDGGVLIVPSAERLPTALEAKLARALDTGSLQTERDGFSTACPTRFGIIALDEGIDDERTPDALRDRLALAIDLDGISSHAQPDSDATADHILNARRLLSLVATPPDAAEALAEAAATLGIYSVRAILFALRAARAAAARDGRTRVIDDDLALAASLVLAPRATVFPVEEQPAEEQPPPPPESSQNQGEDDTEPTPQDLADMILAAAAAAIPARLLDLLRDKSRPVRRCQSEGRAGSLATVTRRGRPSGIRRGRPAPGARLNLVETLRAAAPWQPIRRRTGDRSRRIEVRLDDFRTTRLKHHVETTTIFVVDASGSSALHRLAEAKGAVELLLADCYVRRDQVALIAFRGTNADVLLEPTRSLVRAKRCLASLPGGGGTPMATAVEKALELSLAARRKGRSPTLVFLTDGRANIDRHGKPGRAQADSDAMIAARAIAGQNMTALLIDTSPKKSGHAETLARAMHATYLPLPHASARTVSEAVRLATS